jgi:4-hydroxybenzoate polyprenyltransferase
MQTAVRNNNKTGLIGRCLLDLASLLRFYTSLIIPLVVFCVARRWGVSIARSVYLATPFLFGGMGGFALNDFFDVKRDLVNRPYRPLPRGAITSFAAAVIGLGLLTIACMTAMIVSESQSDRLSYGTFLVALVAYNYLDPKLAILKTLFTASVVAMPFVFLFRRFPYHEISWVYALSVMLFITGREIWMDVHDVQGDQDVGMKTLPVLIGSRCASLVGGILQLLGCLTLLTMGAVIGKNATVVAIATTFACAVIVCCWSWSRNREIQKRLIWFSWIPMLVSLRVLFVA